MKAWMKAGAALCLALREKRAMKPSLMVSVHIPKTAGINFLNNTLRPAFGDRILCDYDNDKPMAHDDTERNMHALHFVPSNELLTRYDCIHGHFLPMKYANATDTRHCIFVCWLRDPVQRVMSRFFYAKRATPPPDAPKANFPVKNMTFNEYLHWDRLHNTYAKFLWNFDIQRFDFIGITDDYERSINVFRRRFGIDTCVGKTDNINPDKNIHKPYDVSGKTREIIERNNAEDMNIYEQGKRHLDDLDRSMR